MQQFFDKITFGFASLDNYTNFVQTLYKEHISSALPTEFCYYKQQLHAQQMIIILYKSVNYFSADAIISIITINLQCQAYTEQPKYNS